MQKLGNKRISKLSTTVCFPRKTHIQSYLSDRPDLSRLIRAHKKPLGLIKSETCGSETIVVPDIVSYLPTFVDIDVAHDVDNCSLAVRRRYWPSVGKINLGDCVTRRTLAIPTYESDYSVPFLHWRSEA